MNTKNLPTDKNGNVYYGPTTYEAAVSQIDEGATPEKVAEMMAGAGYTGIAAKIRSEYGCSYRIAFVMADGEWDVVAEFRARDDNSANAYAEENYSDKEWFVLNSTGKNINCGE